MRIFIEPTEPLLFRTGRPFTAGEYNFAESIFPPTPETMQGAIRAAIAVQWGQAQQPPRSNLNDLFQEPELVNLIGDRQKYGRFRMTGLTPGRRDTVTGKVEPLFPMPAHIIRTHLKDAQGRKFTQLLRLIPRKPEQGTGTNLPAETSFLLTPEMLPEGCTTDGKSEALAGWLTYQSLQTILQGDLPPDNEEHLLRHEQVFVKEARMGIGMNNDTKTTKEGFLYQIQMVRMLPHYGFIADIAFGDKANGERPVPVDESQEGVLPGKQFLGEGWLTLGGERRVAHFEVLEEQEFIKQRKTGNLVYFATPAYFEDGWLARKADLFPAHPITAAINRYHPIGGWYLNTHDAGGEIKTTRRCIPAGSIYFFEQPITVMHPLTEYGWQIGYGITYTGEWKA